MKSEFVSQLSNIWIARTDFRQVRIRTRPRAAAGRSAPLHMGADQKERPIWFLRLAFIWTDN